MRDTLQIFGMFHNDTLQTAWKRISTELDIRETYVYRCFMGKLKVRIEDLLQFETSDTF